MKNYRFRKEFENLYSIDKMQIRNTITRKKLLIIISIFGKNIDLSVWFNDKDKAIFDKKYFDGKITSIEKAHKSIEDAYLNYDEYCEFYDIFTKSTKKFKENISVNTKQILEMF